MNMYNIIFLLLNQLTQQKGFPHFDKGQGRQLKFVALVGPFGDEEKLSFHPNLLQPMHEIAANTGHVVDV
jgi:hypothetical protein